MSEEWTRSAGFDLLCRRLLEVFPSEPPQVACDQDWGSYYDANRAFERHGSNWSCAAIMENRECVIFTNDDAYLFFLPRMISCCLDKDGLNPDICDYLVFGLEHRISELTTLFSPEQKASLLAPLEYLFGGMALEYNLGETETKTMRKILAALRGDRS